MALSLEMSLGNAEDDLTLCDTVADVSAEAAFEDIDYWMDPMPLDLSRRFGICWNPHWKS